MDYTKVLENLITQKKIQMQDISPHLVMHTSDAFVTTENALNKLVHVVAPMDFAVPAHV